VGVRNRGFHRAVLVLFAFVLLASGLFAGLALSAHAESCCVCSQTAESAVCAVYIKLQDISRQIADVFAPAALIVAVLSALYVWMQRLVGTRRFVSLVGLNVKLSC